MKRLILFSIQCVVWCWACFTSPWISGCRCVLASLRVPSKSVSSLRVLIVHIVVHIGACFRIVELSFEREALVRETGLLEHIVGKTIATSVNLVFKSVLHCKSISSICKWTATLYTFTVDGVSNNAKARGFARRSTSRVLNCSHSCPTYVVVSICWLADTAGKCAYNCIVLVINLHARLTSAPVVFCFTTTKETI